MVRIKAISFLMTGATNYETQFNYEFRRDCCANYADTATRFVAIYHLVTDGDCFRQAQQLMKDQKR
ncbi:MAG: hypothetical protein ACLQHK_13430 [Gallionellaceae bacterium]